MSNNSKLLWRSSFIVFLSFCVILFAIYLLESFIEENSTYLWVFVALAIAALLFFAYIVTSFILDPIFKTNFLLDSLLKNTLHELNIPLSTIKANTQLLKLDASDVTKKRVLRIEKASENLYRLYEEIDYYIKREISLVKEEVFDISNVLLDTIEQVSYLDRSIVVSSKVPTYKIKADRIGFNKVLLNLLSNAYKYNKKNGNIWISLKEHKLSIEDSGVGMSEEAKLHLFDRYYQQNSSSKGYGIGLSIVKDFCDKHGIFISLISHEEKGTKVSLSLKHLHVKD